MGSPLTVCRRRPWKVLPTACALRSRALLQEGKGFEGTEPRGFNSRFALHSNAHSHFQRQHQRRQWLVALGFTGGALGWVLFFLTLYTMNDLFGFLQFLDVAFPRKWHSLRLCFDLLPPDEKLNFVNEFRKLQLKGYDDSLFEYIMVYHPDTVSATGLTVTETLQRLNYVNRLVYENGEESQHLWVELVKKLQRKHSMSPPERLAELLRRAPATIVDAAGNPAYAGQDIFALMPPPEPCPSTSSVPGTGGTGWRLL